MKRVLTDNIVANVRRQRFPKSSLDHLQDATAEGLKALLATLNIDPATPTIISGAETDYQPAEESGTKFVNAGWMAYEGNVYEIVENTNLVLAASKTIVFDFQESFTANDPVSYDDGNSFNVNQIIRVVTRVDDPDEGLVDYYDANNLQVPKWIDLVLENGAESSASVLYNNLPSPAYYKDAFGVVHLRGVLTLPDLNDDVVYFTLPEGFRPTTNWGIVDRMSLIADGFTRIQPNGQFRSFIQTRTFCNLYNISFPTR